MAYKISTTHQFEKDLKRCIRRGNQGVGECDHFLRPFDHSKVVMMKIIRRTDPMILSVLFTLLQA